ncbi:MAG: hypothetical protein KDB07_06880, partial [Planctomycetes bacterium]|nr:hypothetical protein [Planctomycetota bacterium]
MPVEEYSFGPDEEKRVSFEYSDPLSTGVVRVDGLVVLEFAALSELIEGRARQLSKEVEIELCAFEKSKAYQIGPPSYGILIKANGVLLAGSTYHVSNRNRWFSQTLFILGVFVVMPLLSKCVEHGLEEALNAEKKALLISGIGTLVCVNGAKNGSRAIGLVG